MSAHPPSTSVTLLEWLRKPDQPVAWERFTQFYTPLMLLLPPGNRRDIGVMWAY